MELEVEVGRADQSKTVKFETQYESPSDWIDQEPDGDFIWTAYEAFEKQALSDESLEMKKWLMNENVTDFLIMHDLIDKFLDKWRNSNEEWFDAWAKSKWITFEENNFLND